MSRPAALLLLVAAGLGCGGGGGPADGGVAEGGAPDGGPAAAPDIPWLLPDGGVALEVAPPRLTPCPEGWREVVSETAVVSCDPYPEGGPALCPPGQAHFPGEPGCAPIGSSCPAGDFADGLPDDGTVLFVLAGASGGDGTRSRPHGTIGEALGRAVAGTTVAVGRGRYEEVVTVRVGVTLRGACSEATLLAYSGMDPRLAVINVAAAGVSVADLGVGPSDRAGVAVSGAGVEVVLQGLEVTGTTGVGVFATGGARLSARGLVVRETRGDARGALGRGLHVELGASAEVSRALFERNRDVGVIAESDGTMLGLTDVVVRDTEPQQSDGAGGRGLGVQLGASAEVSRALFERNRDLGVFAADAAADGGATLRLADVVVRDTEGRESDGAFGRGLGVQLGASAEVSRALFERNRDQGVFASNQRTTLALTDVVVRDTEPRRSDGAFGRGLGVQLGASAEVSRALFERNRGSGVLSTDDGTTLVLTDVVVRDTDSQESDGALGRGLGVQLGAAAQVSRALFERNRELGFFAHGNGTTLVLHDVVVRDTEGRESDGAVGRGLGVQLGASAEVGRVLFERNRELGVFAFGEGTVVRLGDVVIRDTRPDGAGLGGVGAGSYVLASLELRRFAVTRSALAGVQLAREGVVDLHEGEVASNPIGVNVQTDGFDLARLMDRVVYRDNGSDLAEETLPVPEPGLPVEGL